MACGFVGSVKVPSFSRKTDASRDSPHRKVFPQLSRPPNDFGHFSVALTR
jgi:hypothetical protein